MRRWTLRFVLLVLTTVAVACQSGEAITFPDDNLENAIRTEINQPEEPIMSSDIDDITEIDLADEEITDLSGIEEFKSLTDLNLKNNQIDDFSPLKELENIKYVNLVGNDFNDDQNEYLDYLWDNGVKVVTMEEADGPGGYLWEVQEGDTTVFLQGTIHAGPKDFYPMNKEVEQAYNKADVVVPEIDTTSPSLEKEMTELYVKFGMYQDGSTISDHISDDVYVELKDFLDEHSLPDEIEYYKPWLLSNIIDSFMLEEIGYIYGVDDYFLDRAKDDKKDIKPLETAEDQLTIFSDTSDDYQVELLKASLSDRDNYENEMLDLFHLYTQGDEEDLATYLEPDFDVGHPLYEEDKSFSEALNDKRNMDMSHQIAQFLNEDNDDTYFVIVGTAHLISEPSVISLLKEKGFDVEKIH